MQELIKVIEATKDHLKSTEANTARVDVIYSVIEKEITAQAKSIIDFHKKTSVGYLNLIQNQFLLIENLIENINQLKHDLNVADLLKPN